MVCWWNGYYQCFGNNYSIKNDNYRLKIILTIWMRMNVWMIDFILTSFYRTNQLLIVYIYFSFFWENTNIRKIVGRVESAIIAPILLTSLCIWLFCQVPIGQVLSPCDFSIQLMDEKISIFSIFLVYSKRESHISNVKLDDLRVLTWIYTYWLLPSPVKNFVKYFYNCSYLQDL